MRVNVLLQHKCNQVLLRMAAAANGRDAASLLFFSGGLVSSRDMSGLNSFGERLDDVTRR
jgi:hypothetical protein